MIYRVHKNQNYTVMSNHHFRDKELSLKAKGLLSMILSLPETWNYSVEGLTALSTDGKDSVRGAIKELEVGGYIVRRQGKVNGKFANSEYDVYEKPMTENPTTENPMTENPTQLNTYKLNTQELNTIAEQSIDEQIEKIIGVWNQLNRVSGKVQRIIPMTKRYNDTFYTIGQYGFDIYISTMQKLDSLKWDYKPSYDWFCSINNFIKVNEGNYDTKFGDNSASQEWIEEWIKNG